MEIAPSILSCDFSNLEKEIKKVEKAGADYIHLDVMDGVFVKNITFGAPVIKSIRHCTDLPFDVHLMINEPKRYIEDFVESGADIITIHNEAESDVSNTLKLIKSFGVKCGLSVKPKTNIDGVYSYLKQLDLVLIMTVEPGFGGQTFINDMMEKVKVLRKKIDADGLDIKIEVDGGINENTAKIAKNAGADICVAGTSVFKSENISLTIKKLKNC